jgi:hypothetical protein
MIGRKSLVLSLVAGLGLLAASLRHEVVASPGEAGWQPMAWPFPRDAWPAGRAYHCSAAHCGVDVEVYIRPKIGFCNCATGVADDDEVDRVTDLDLISERFNPVGAGAEIRVSDLSGRVRSYQLEKSDGSFRSAEGIALSRKCDLIVAVVEGNAASEQTHAAVQVLLTEAVTTWVRDVIEGR